MIAEAQPNAVVDNSVVLVNPIPDHCIAWPGAHGGIRSDQDDRENINYFIRWHDEDRTHS